MVKRIFGFVLALCFCAAAFAVSYYPEWLAGRAFLRRPVWNLDKEAFPWMAVHGH
jgi:hypothetical protein